MADRRPIRTEADPGPVVLVVDDDDGMRAALQRLLTLAKLPVELYASGVEFLAAARLDRPGCILLDISMPQMSGLEVQACLKQRHVALPIVFLTGSSDIPIAVTAMREGAVDFIEKPFGNDDLVTRVRAAIEQHEHLRRGDAEHAALLGLVQKLTPREREIMDLVVTGLTSKEIARIVGASHRTVEIHRGRVMEKMAAATLADLVRKHLSLQRDSSTS
jgi:FixJ family two-component response regulator